MLPMIVLPLLAVPSVAGLWIVSHNAAWFVRMIPDIVPWGARLAGVILLLVILIDLRAELTNRDPVGTWLARWSGRHPLYAVSITAFFGMLLAHVCLIQP